MKEGIRKIWSSWINCNPPLSGIPQKRRFYLWMPIPYKSPFQFIPFTMGHYVDYWDGKWDLLNRWTINFLTIKGENQNAIYENQASNLAVGKLKPSDPAIFPPPLVNMLRWTGMVPSFTGMTTKFYTAWVLINRWMTEQILGESYYGLSCSYLKKWARSMTTGVLGDLWGTFKCVSPAAKKHLSQDPILVQTPKSPIDVLHACMSLHVHSEVVGGFRLRLLLSLTL